MPVCSYHWSSAAQLKLVHSILLLCLWSTNFSMFCSSLYGLCTFYFYSLVSFLCFLYYLLFFSMANSFLYGLSTLFSMIPPVTFYVTQSFFSLYRSSSSCQLLVQIILYTTQLSSQLVSQTNSYYFFLPHLLSLFGQFANGRRGKPC